MAVRRQRLIYGDFRRILSVCLSLAWVAWVSVSLIRSAFSNSRNVRRTLVWASAMGGVVAVVFAALLFWAQPGGDTRFAFAALLLVNLLLVLVILATQYLHLKSEQEEMRRIRLLADMNVQVNREILLNENIELIYRTILDYLFSIFNTVNTGSVLVLGEDRCLTFAASRGFTEEFVTNFRLPLEDSFLYQETNGDIRDVRLIDSDHLAKFLVRFDPGGWKFSSVISAPIFVGDRLFGILNLDSSKPGTFNARDTVLMEQFRSQIEVALLACEQYRANIERYHVDSLTGLLTRRYFEDLFDVQLERASRYEERFVVALFDVDGLKQVNDQHGHLVGDKVLLEAANAIRASCRKSDIVGRFGGDEFIALYHAADTASLERNLLLALAQLKARAIDIGDQAIHSAFCFGLATYPDEGRSLEALTEMADGRLYAMKQSRRAGRA